MTINRRSIACSLTWILAIETSIAEPAATDVRNRSDIPRCGSLEPCSIKDRCDDSSHVCCDGLCIPTDGQVDCSNTVIIICLSIAAAALIMALVLTLVLLCKKYQCCCRRDGEHALCPSACDIIHCVKFGMNSNRRLDNRGSQSSEYSDHRRPSPYEPRLPKYSSSSQHELIIDSVAVVNNQSNNIPPPNGTCPEQEPPVNNPPPPYTITQSSSPGYADEPPEYINEEKINELS